MKLGLFNGRHELPVENYIFFEAVDPTSNSIVVLMPKGVSV